MVANKSVSDQVLSSLSFPNRFEYEECRGDSYGGFSTTPHQRRQQGQHVGGLKSLSFPAVRKNYRVADKMFLVSPVVRALLVRGVVSILPSAAIDNFVLMDIKKVGTF